MDPSNMQLHKALHGGRVAFGHAAQHVMQPALAVQKLGMGTTAQAGDPEDPLARHEAA